VRHRRPPADAASSLYAASQELPAMTALRLIDILLVLVTAPVVALLGAPVLGTLVGAAAWVLQRATALFLESRAKRAQDVRSALSINLAGVVGRSWLVALTILAVGLAGDREDGLAAGILTIVAFTFYLATSLAVRSLERSSAPS
jgi:hypothetical protein